MMEDIINYHTKFMAYDKKEIFKTASEEIVKNNLFFIDDVVAYVPCSRSTFYSYYPDGSDELDKLKGLLDENRMKLKVSMRSKWYKSNAPALQMALMKLICTDEELKKLSMSYNDHTTQGKEINPPTIVFKKFNAEE